MPLQQYRRMFQEAEASLGYWQEATITEFTEELTGWMKTHGVSRIELARRLGTSRAYVTQLLGGSTNFTLATMVRVAMALEAVLHVHLAGRDDDGSGSHMA